MTEYLVMRQLADSENWTDLDTVDAPNARVAVRNAMKENRVGEGTFRALPKRSAAAYTVKTETQTRTVWA